MQINIPKLADAQSGYGDRQSAQNELHGCFLSSINIALCFAFTAVFLSFSVEVLLLEESELQVSGFEPLRPASGEAVVDGAFGFFCRTGAGAATTGSASIVAVVAASTDGDATAAVGAGAAYEAGLCREKAAVLPLLVEGEA